jgi:alpha-ribazole phosphatase/probable phosphoglycerate mutase
MIPSMNRVNRVYLVRHGQVVGYENFPVYGHTDVALTEVGRLQTEYLAERLRLTPIRAIYCSDLKRSAMGAQIIARYHDVPVHVLPEFREVYFGDWEGLSLQEIHEQFPEELEKRKKALMSFCAPGNGESVAHLSERIMACYRKILGHQEGHDLLIVGHGAVNRVILCDALGLDLVRMFNLHQDYGCLNIIDYFPDSTLVRVING